MNEDAHMTPIYGCQCCGMEAYCKCSLSTCGSCKRCVTCCRCTARNFRSYRPKADALAVAVDKEAENKRADKNLTQYDKMLLKGMLIRW